MAEILDGELLEMTLRDLSRTLPSNTSSASTLATYLRWLEIHRQEDTKCTNHWVNTLVHWTQALKNRGFSEEELMSKVNTWKEENGPFRSHLRRYPPMPRDIGRGFAEKEIGKMDKEGAWTHLTGFEGPPPKNYICNRCGKGGHHLQVCPTNMDPAYDKPPGQHYICVVCKAEGAHYKSLCPRNLDPYSINQKRKAAGTSQRGILEEWESDRQTWRERSESFNQSSPNMKRSLDIENLDPRYNGGESTDWDDMEMLGVSSGKHARDDWASMEGMISKRARGATWSGNVTIREHGGLGEDGITIIGGEVQDTAEFITEGPIHKYSAFVRNLSARSGGYMSEVVNPVKNRPTALDMWEQEDIDRIMDSSIIDYEVDQGADNSNPFSSSSDGTPSPVQNMSGRLTPYGEESD